MKKRSMQLPNYLDWPVRFMHFIKPPRPGKNEKSQFGSFAMRFFICFSLENRLIAKHPSHKVSNAGSWNSMLKTQSRVEMSVLFICFSMERCTQNLRTSWIDFRTSICFHHEQVYQNTSLSTEIPQQIGTSHGLVRSCLPSEKHRQNQGPSMIFLIVVQHLWYILDK